MGRRKIEIQPITHERNRSVTFLKRKNGLFKKAYELGVLCSVDVAVIIFEERPGHHLKLYQYCSTDVHDIVQRHIRYDGEKDSRGPNDFSGGSSAKLDDLGDGDDDDVDDEDDLPRKRKHDGKLKPAHDMAMGDLDYVPSHRMSIPQPPMPMHGLPPSGGSSSLPISSDRHIPRNGPPHHHSASHMHNPNKKQRIGLHHSHSRSPSDEAAGGPGAGGPSGGGGYPYPQQPSAPFARQHNQYHPPPPPPPHHSASNNTQYTPFFPVNAHTPPPPPSFIPLQSDFPPPSNARAGGRGGGGFPARSGSSGSAYETPLYPGMMRHQGHGSSHHGGGGGGQGPGGGGGSSGGGGGAGGNGDLFAAFLDADEHNRQSQNQPAASFALDWPVHNPNPASGGGGSSSSVSNPSASSSSGPGPENTSNTWLDFLSGSNPPGSTGAGGGPPSQRETGMSWERGGDRGDITEIFGASGERTGGGGGSGGGGGGAGGGLSAFDRPGSGRGVGGSPMVGRPRVSDGDDALGSPGLMNVNGGRDDVKKDGKDGG